MSERIAVAVIGGGPSGLALATHLATRPDIRGLGPVVVLEREPVAGGIPRHCGHSPFGMREFHRVLSGARYTARLVAAARAAGVDIRCNVDVVALGPEGHLAITSPEGVGELVARRVVLATGARETPRAGRLISGDRPLGVLNTGALQGMVHLENRRPFQRPLVVGTELVAFSALLTCRQAKIHPVAMIDAGAQATARWPAAVLPHLLGVPLWHHTRLLRINGDARVRSVTLRQGDKTRDLACDGVLLCGDFTPESALARLGHLRIDPATGGPLVDQFDRCSDPAYFACGNVLRGIETAGFCWSEGRRVGDHVAASLAGDLPAQGGELAVDLLDSRLKYVMPQRISPGRAGAATLQLRVTCPVHGALVARQNDREIARRRIDTRPERRLLLTIDSAALQTDAGPVTLSIEAP